MNVISIQLSDEEKEAFNAYAEFHNKSLETILKEALKEKIEDEIDTELIREYEANNEKNAETYTHGEVKVMFDIDKD